jgi:uncharacterized protein (TIGR04255 family)
MPVAMHYQSNHLTKVVLRLDFDPLAILSQIVKNDVKPEFSARIAETFPIVVSQPTVNVSFNIGPTGAGVNQQITGMQWQHRKIQNGTCVAVLAPNFLALEYGKKDYDHFPPFRGEAEIILEVFQALYRVPTFNRIGLRYINEIVLPEGNPLDWNGLLSPDIITAVKACMPNDVDMVRSMHQLQVRANECTMLFNYGLHNPDFPNTLARRAFVLDYDGTQTGVASNDALHVIDSLNEFCEKMFESSIEEQFRIRLGVIDDE